MIYFMRALDMPSGLAAVGYSEQDIPALVAGTLPQHRVTKLSPVPAGEAELTKLFPEPAVLQDAPLEEIGLPSARAEALRALSRQVRDGHWSLDGSAELEELVQHLSAAPGIGPWTAHMLAMRVAGELDAFPASDVEAELARRVAKPASGPRGSD